jgi:hypothetical protein
MHFRVLGQFLVSCKRFVASWRRTLTQLCPGRTVHVSDMSSELVMFGKLVITSVLVALYLYTDRTVPSSSIMTKIAITLKSFSPL